MPLTGNPRKDIRKLHEENKRMPKGKKRSRKQMLAIAMSKAKQAGY